MTDAGARRRRPLRRWLLRALLAACVLAAGAEIGLRAWAAARGVDVEAVLGRAHPEGGLYVPHPYIGYALRPEPGDPDHDALGLRGPEPAVPKPAGTVRILCLGGSTTYGSGLDADEAYPARLEARLRARAASGVRYEVLNCGVPGYSSAESLVAFALRFTELEPDGIVVYHGINDARLIQTRGFRPDYAHMRTAWREPRRSAVEWWLLRHSRAWAWGAHALGFGLKSVRLEDLIFVEDAETLFDPPAGHGVNAEGVRAFLRNVAHIVALARAHDAEVVLATFAMRAGAGPPRAQDFAPTVDAMNAGLRALAAREGLPLADLAASLDGRPELFRDVVHLNAQGTAVQADRILRAAAEAGAWGL